jgi:hypothetical protein
VLSGEATYSNFSLWLDPKKKSLTYSLADNVKKFAYCKTKWLVNHLEGENCANVNDELEMYNKCKSVPKCNRFSNGNFCQLP